MSISEVTIFSDPFSPPSSLFVTIFGNSLSSPLGDVNFDEPNLLKQNFQKEYRKYLPGSVKIF